MSNVQETMIKDARIKGSQIALSCFRDYSDGNPEEGRAARDRHIEGITNVLCSLYGNQHFHTIHTEAMDAARITGRLMFQLELDRGHTPDFHMYNYTLHEGQDRTWIAITKARYLWWNGVRNLPLELLKPRPDIDRKNPDRGTWYDTKPLIAACEGLGTPPSQLQLESIQYDYENPNA